MSSKPSQSATTLAVALLMGFAVGAGVTAVALNASAPPTLSQQESVDGAFMISLEPFENVISVELTAPSPTPQTLEFPISGVVIDTSCRPGNYIESGDSIAKVNGNKIVALSTSIPQWRNLTSGTRGEDVKSINDELVRLGKIPESPGSVATRSTIDSLVKLAGLDAGTNTVPPGTFVWLPSKKSSGVIAPPPLVQLFPRATRSEAWQPHLKSSTSRGYQIISSPEIVP